jgi:hypothetical protein
VLPVSNERLRKDIILSILVTKGMVEMQYQAVNHTTFDTIKIVATMIPYRIMGLRLFSILFKSSGKNVKN